MFSVCKECKIKFRHFPSRRGLYCSKKCTYINKDFRNKQSKAKLGKPNWRKGKTRFNNEEEKKQANLVSGRKSYRKHVKERLFYYRQLSFKRRGTLGNFTKKQWEDMKIKYNQACVICKLPEPFIGQRCDKLTIDHIIPISKGGTNNIENIQPLCLSCNIIKRDRDTSYAISKITDKLALKNKI